jgi:hypothetical protein
MDTSFLEQLLNESESASLDFKREQYPFEGVDNQTKGELLKDILAFVNAWRRTDAYILIGVDEKKGRVTDICGVRKHLDDHSLQQFVNSKTQTPVTFSYFSLEYQGKSLGVIHIPLQTRPVFLSKDFGKLKKHVVYIRRGSSTDEALPDEVAKMGQTAVEGLHGLSLDLQFADPYSHTAWGQSITIEGRFLRLSTTDIPNFSPAQPGFSWGLSSPNRNYYRELVSYYKKQLLFSSVGFRLHNLGQTTAHNVRMVTTVEKSAELQLLAEEDFPDTWPRKYEQSSFALDPLFPDRLSSLPTVNISDVNLYTYGPTWELEVEFGNIQPKAVVWPTGIVYIGSTQTKTVQLTTQLFADNLPDPISVDLHIDFKTEVVDIDFSELKERAMKEEERLREEQQKWLKERGYLEEE